MRLHDWRLEGNIRLRAISYLRRKNHHSLPLLHFCLTTYDLLLTTI
jgi:hypothetical protein